MHRRLLLDDILASIARLPSSKRSLRTYRLNSEEHIQMLTALVLQLIQCVVVLPEKLQDTVVPIKEEPTDTKEKGKDAKGKKGDKNDKEDLNSKEEEDKKKASALNVSIVPPSSRLRGNDNGYFLLCSCYFF